MWFIVKFKLIHTSKGLFLTKSSILSSTQIERWWRELHNRLEMFFKRQLMMLLERGHYDPNNQTDR